MSDATQAKPIWTKLQQGAIIRTRMFDPSHRANFMFVGCNAWADSKIQIATAPAPEGPWSEFIPVGPVPGIEYTEGYRYCVYPHPWMGTAGVMGVSWSEHWPGGVILGRLEFELEEQRGKVEGEGEYAAPPVETRGQSQKLFFCC